MAVRSLPRRELLTGVAAGVALALLPRITRAAGPTLMLTPPLTAGPFYPGQTPIERDADLVQFAGRRAKGDWLELAGRVLDERGRALRTVRVEIWQCDANSRYHHPADRRDAPRDEGFQGYGETVTGAGGDYRFRTIRPVPYPGRTPHIHFRLSGPGFEPFTTQMFVAGDPGNARDGIYNAIRDRALRDSVTVPLLPVDSNEAKFAARFDLALVADGRLGLL